MKFEFEVSKKSLFFILTLFVLAISSILVYAYNPTNDPEADPSVFGHSLNELSELGCNEGDVLSSVNGVISCTSPAISSCSIPSEAVFMFQGGCPTEYPNRVTTLDGKFPRGAPNGLNGGATGGSLEHFHTIIQNNVPYPIGTDDFPQIFYFMGNTLTSSNLPPYLNVVWCKK